MPVVLAIGPVPLLMGAIGWPVGAEATPRARRTDPEPKPPPDPGRCGNGGYRRAGDGVRDARLSSKDLRDTALYHSGLVAHGNTTRGGIAGYIGRKAVDISHPLTVLEDCHLLAREQDVFRTGKSVYRITEPLINFYEAVMRPAWARLESGQGRQVWDRSKERFAAQVVGPHFEAICREYMLGDGVELLGPEAMFGEIGSGVVTDPTARKQIQIDVAVTRSGDGGRRAAVSMLGEAKWGATMGIGHLDRLTRAREVLAASGSDMSDCRLACFSGAGFSDALRRRADQDSDVLLIGLPELYP
ncbi:hypothetical protein [Nocardia bovistercoris]|uniref:Uncharacterized protein n=1 Tax=Nocardia bovistercoris TaxID=2785916 RepID=A0A931N3W6_9NOCA|nr:hypothetical protein [Nocardia bovistercoris]MBH0776993.1 hypothetical protein [Nocardia bovistercoris]